MSKGNTVRVVFADGYSPDDKPPVWTYKFKGLKHGEEVSIYIGKDGKIHDINAWGISTNASVYVEQEPT